MPNSAGAPARVWSRSPWLPAVLIAGAAGIAYASSFAGVFQFDDIPAILENPTLHRLWPLSAPLAPPPGALTVSGRPVLNFSLALNYAVSAYGPWSYHALNLAIHVAAALTLFGLIRRTLAEMRAGGETGIALAAALFWAVHPLTTESVTYVVQRAESLAALFYLLTLYCFVRSTAAPSPAARNGWRVGSVMVCLLGMGTKETVVSAPLAVLLYDRTFVAHGWQRAWAAGKGFYGALACTWVPLLLLAAGNGWDRGATSGFQVGVAWLPYWISQGEAVARYLALCFWPAPLAFDYGPPSASPGWALAVFAALCAAIAITALGCLRGRPWAFLAGCALLVLAPSSVMPGVLQFASEHRMYLPLAAVMCAAAWAAYRGLHSWVRTPRQRQFATAALVAAASAALALTTAARNRIYTSDLALWRDTVDKRPRSPTAQANLGRALLEGGRRDEAMPHCLEAVRLGPNLPTARYNLGLAYEEKEKWDEALAEFKAAADLNPKLFYANFRAGRLLDRLGQPAEAAILLRRAVAIQPAFADAHGSLGVAEAALGQPAAAIEEFGQSLRLDPAQPEVEFDLAVALSRQGRLPDAALHYANAARLRPAYWQAQLNLGIADAQLDRIAEARAALEQAVKLRPDSADAHANLAGVLDQSGHTAEAIAEYRSALQLRPAYPEAHYNLGNALLRGRNLAAARAEYAEALRLNSSFAPARQMLERLDRYTSSP